MSLWSLRWKAVLNWLQIDPQFPRIHSPESTNSFLKENQSATSSLTLSHPTHVLEGLLLNNLGETRGTDSASGLESVLALLSFC